MYIRYISSPCTDDKKHVCSACADGTFSLGGFPHTCTLHATCPAGTHLKSAGALLLSHNDILDHLPVTNKHTTPFRITIGGVSYCCARACDGTWSGRCFQFKPMQRRQAYAVCCMLTRVHVTLLSAHPRVGPACSVHDVCRDCYGRHWLCSMRSWENIFFEGKRRGVWGVHCRVRRWLCYCHQVHHNCGYHVQARLHCILGLHGSRL